eukprot:TRINITY_DN31_c0_g1_i2.p1 TRINITY_DN31_c0_g1~~TRINITY_DN31_c0_g1_i2.p1  ORF type:complete len:255 (-),score=34.92 TRINITY_DN31_c0_g1_i2:783-1547(-)
MFLQVLIVGYVASMVFCAPSPVPVFDSYGANELFQDEGEPIKSPAGNDLLSNATADQCAEVCHWMLRVCDCCNSFSYNPSTEECYLKKRREDALQDRVSSNNGFQSYKFWGTVSAIPGDVYTGGLPELAKGSSVGPPPGFPYNQGFSSLGPNKLADFQGDDIQSFTNVDAKQCANECLAATSDCDGFSYNPQQNGGTCFLKKNSASGKYQTSFNSDGFTFYWKETGTRWFTNCYCTCASSFVCLTCTSTNCDAI